MKLIVLKYTIFYLLIHKVLLITYKNYKNNDLIMNFSDDFIKKFQDNKNFLRYTNNLIDKVKLRIKEKLINSFILRIEREKNAEEHLKRLYKGDFQSLNVSDYFSTDVIQKGLLADNDYLEYLGNPNENKDNNFTLKKFSAVDFNNSSSFNLSNRIKENSTNSYLNKKSKRLINLLVSLKSSKKFIDFTSVFLDSDEEFQSKFNEREILQYIRNLNEINKRKKQDENQNNSNSLAEAHSTNAKKKKSKFFNFEIDSINSKKNNSNEKENKTNLITKEEEANATEKLFEKKRKNKESLSDQIKNLNLINVNYDIPESKAKRRKIKFFIDLENDCDIYINDTVHYENNKELNMIDHLILHNDVENIDPRSINSENREINYFIFNRRLNMFSVNFENHMENQIESELAAAPGTEKDFEINYEYMANNLIKSSQFILKAPINSTNYFTKNNSSFDNNFNNINKRINFNLNNTDDNLDKNFNDDEESFWNNFQNSYLFDNNITSYLFGNLKKKNKKLLEKNIKKFNEFIWRVNNENNEQNIYLELEFLFALGDNFDYNKIKFNFKTTRTSKFIYDKEFQIFSWKGVLLPYEVKNIKCAFPLAFESCGNRINYDLSIFMLLSLFVVFVVLIIYLISKIIF